MEPQFVALITQHQALIYKVCHLYADTPADVEDLFQEIVINLWQGYARFDGRAAVTTWMYRVALNTAITQLRRRKRTPATTPMVAQAIAPPLRDEQSAQLYAAVRELNRIERAVVSLYLDGYRYAEISAMLGISESNVGVRLNRIKQKLRRLLDVTQEQS